MKKSLVLTPKAIQWGRDNGYGDLMDELERFREAYRFSWQSAQKQRLLQVKMTALQKYIDEHSDKLGNLISRPTFPRT